METNAHVQHQSLRKSLWSQYKHGIAFGVRLV